MCRKFNFILYLFCKAIENIKKLSSEVGYFSKIKEIPIAQTTAQMTQNWKQCIEICLRIPLCTSLCDQLNSLRNFRIVVVPLA
jgi:hypothetical protein